MSEPRVTDHALVRFLQRSGLDVERVRADLASSLARAQAAAESLGIDDHLVVADGLCFLVREGAVVTCLADSIGTRAKLLDRQSHP